MDRVQAPSAASSDGAGDISDEEGESSDDGEEGELTEAQAALLRATLAKMGAPAPPERGGDLSGAQQSLLERTLQAAHANLTQPLPPMPPTPPQGGHHYDSADTFARALALKVAQEWEHKRTSSCCLLCARGRFPSAQSSASLGLSHRHSRHACDNVVCLHAGGSQVTHCSLHAVG